MSELPELPPGFRRFHPDDVHLTLVFLGACGEERAKRALDALDEALAAGRPTALDVTLGEVVPMGRARQYTALSALLERGRTETESLIARLRDPLSEAAIGRREARPPRAHVTLARPTRRATDEARRQGLAWAGALALGSLERRLDRIALFTWNEDRRERLFRIVTERSLALAST